MTYVGENLRCVLLVVTESFLREKEINIPNYLILVHKLLSYGYYRPKYETLLKRCSKTNLLIERPLMLLKEVDIYFTYVEHCTSLLKTIIKNILQDCHISNKHYPFVDIIDTILKFS
eukprot:UN09493